MAPLKSNDEKARGSRSGQQREGEAAGRAVFVCCALSHPAWRSHARARISPDEAGACRATATPGRVAQRRTRLNRGGCLRALGKHPASTRSVRHPPIQWSRFKRRVLGCLQVSKKKRNSFYFKTRHKHPRKHPPRNYDFPYVFIHFSVDKAGACCKMIRRRPQRCRKVGATQRRARRRRGVGGSGANLERSRAQFGRSQAARRRGQKRERPKAQLLHCLRTRVGHSDPVHVLAVDPAPALRWPIRDQIVRPLDRHDERS